MLVDAILKYGLEKKEISNRTWDGSGHYLVDWDGTTVVEDDSLTNEKVICADVKEDTSANHMNSPAIELDNFTDKTRLKLVLEDGEVDDYLKIYTNYVRVDDGNGDWHYDLYFNIQNLFNSPFEYISSITNQPNVLIIPDSYLYLSGDKFTDGKIDENKVKRIHEGGELSIYGQVKTYSNDMLSDVRTIKLFTYKVYNVSDAKPKFLIEKVFDITKVQISNDIKDKVLIDFSDVMWTIDENKFKHTFTGSSSNTKVKSDFVELNEPVTVVQPVSIRYNWNEKDDYRLLDLSFDIVNDVIDFNGVPRLLGYSTQDRTLRNGEPEETDIYNREWKHLGKKDISNKPYYDHWSDRYMKLDIDKETGIPHLKLKWDSACGFNFERIYLRWELPAGCKVMDTMDRLMGFVFSSTAQNIIATANNSMTPIFDVSVGHVIPRVSKRGEMYLGLEHSTTQRKNGYVLTGLASAIKTALQVGQETNPTLDRYAIKESTLRQEVKVKLS